MVRSFLLNLKKSFTNSESFIPTYGGMPHKAYPGVTRAGTNKSLSRNSEWELWEYVQEGNGNYTKQEPTIRYALSCLREKGFLVPNPNYPTQAMFFTMSNKALDSLRKDLTIIETSYIKMEERVVARFGGDGTSSGGTIDLPAPDTDGGGRGREGTTGGNGGDAKPKLINHSGPGESNYLTWNDMITYINHLGAKYGLTNSGQLVVHHEDGDDFGGGYGDGTVFGVIPREDAIGGSVTPKSVTSLSAKYGVGGVDITIAVGEHGPVESLQCRNENIIALLPTPTAVSTTKLKTYNMAQGGTYAAELRKVDEEEAGGEVGDMLTSLNKVLEDTGFKSKLVGFISDQAKKIKGWFDADIGKKGGKTVEVEGGDDEENTGLKSKNKYSSHDNLGGMGISKGVAAEAAAAGSDWAKAMWEVRVTCLGIPEISGQHEMNRKVTLDVPSPRGDGQSKLSGDYYVHDYVHTIDSSVAFKTMLILRGYPQEE
jgi:hypothetical protein